MERGGRQNIPRPSSHRPGPPAPWVKLPAEQRHFTLAEVRERLASYPSTGPTIPLVAGSRPAAVLVALFEEAGEARLILTKRPDTMPSHRGEIAFPGGKHDDALDATLRDTALREAAEEVGLDPAAVEIVARLDGIATVGSRFVITPFVGFLPQRPRLVPHPREVVAAFDVALSELMGEGVHRAEHWDARIEDHGERDDRDDRDDLRRLGSFDVHFYELADETVWGATARILTDFLAHLAEGRRGR